MGREYGEDMGKVKKGKIHVTDTRLDRNHDMLRFCQ